MKNSDEMARCVLERIKAEQKKRKNRRRILTGVIGALCCCVLLSALYFEQKQWGAEPAIQVQPLETTLSSETTAPAGEKATVRSGFLTLDINPSLQFVIEEGVVVRSIALNDDGVNILGNVDVAGMTLEEALPVVLQELIRAGYIAAEADTAPVLLLAAYDSNGSVELLDTAAALVSDTLAEQDITYRVIAQQITDLEYVEMLAEQYHVSVGKMQYVLNLIRRDRELALEEASDRTVVELFSMDIEQRLIEPEYKIGEYDQYGEKVLYSAGIENPSPGFKQEDVPEAVWNTYEDIYSPEDLAMLMRDRIWTTMPNVVGMNEEEAGALLRSREIVPRVVYEDNLEFREQGFTDGQVFMQDVEPGMRHNSDASVFIWVMAPEMPEDDPGRSQGWIPETPEHDAAESRNCIEEPTEPTGASAAE